MRRVWAGSINKNQISGGRLNLYLFIFRRLIFESSVREGSPSFAAALVVPEIRPLLSASAASIICFSQLHEHSIERLRAGEPGGCLSL
jgi:hypothetical protein